ncbi:MAG TPA: formate dehydrogenase accessory protein FdhE [Chloroflexota bacterium]|nr:formate dehydrogenase accessory protein FdhE [Chloroflexota bacterium]
MIHQAETALEELARADPTIAPLALLLGEARKASVERAWHQDLPAFDASRLDERAPLLHGQALVADAKRVQRLMVRLAALTGQADLGEAIGQGAIQPLAALEAAIEQDAGTLRGLATEAGVRVELLTTLSQVAAFPILQACGREAAPVLESASGASWDAGYCPVCAAWPTLAELRGLERLRWLRCGRCGGSWTYAESRCPFCGTHDHRALGYLAPEADRESRRATTCDECRGYLKSITSLGPLAADEVGVKDLTTLELDVAAVERGYARREEPGFALDVTLEPRSSARRSWMPWKR